MNLFLKCHALPVESTLNMSVTAYFLDVAFRYFSNMVNNAPLHICSRRTYCETAKPKRQQHLINSFHFDPPFLCLFTLGSVLSSIWLPTQSAKESSEGFKLLGKRSLIQHVIPLQIRTIPQVLFASVMLQE